MQHSKEGSLHAPTLWFLQFPRGEIEPLAAVLCEPRMDRFPPKARAAAAKLPALFKTQARRGAPAACWACLAAAAS
jgi:hypothetical protein